MIKSITFFFICHSLWVFAQPNNVFHKTYTKQDGLQLDNIETMVFDHDGFLWLGGSSLDMREIIQGNKEVTLQRFNGKTLHNFPLPTKQGVLPIVLH